MACRVDRPSGRGGHGMRDARFHGSALMLPVGASAVNSRLCGGGCQAASPIEPACEIAEERPGADFRRSEEHTSELQSLMRISYAVFCLKKKKTHKKIVNTTTQDSST